MNIKFLRLFLSPEGDASGGGTAEIDAIGENVGNDFEAEFVRLTTDPNAVADDGTINPVAKAFEDADKAKAAKPAEVKVPTKEAPKDQPKSKIPDALFSPKDQKKEAVVADTPKSALDEIAAPEFKSLKHKEQWDALKAKATEFEKKAAEYEGKIKESDAKGKDSEAIQAKLAELQSKYDEAMGIVRQVNAEADPEFRTKYVDGRKALVEDARRLIDDSGGDAKDVETALALKGKARIEALRIASQSLDGFSQGELGRIIRELDTLDKEADGIRKDPDKFLAERADQERAMRQEQAAQQLKVAQQSFALAESKMANELEVLQRVDGFDEWNATGDKIKSEARSLFENNRDPEVWARTAIEARAAQTYRAMFLEGRKEQAALAAKVADMEKELSGIHSRSPRLIGGKPATGSTNVKDMDFLDRFNHETQR